MWRRTEPRVGPAWRERFVGHVADSGEGIPLENRQKIMDPFFTTKDEGTGLGLSIVHRIVEAHGGAISAANRPEGGARFELRI